MTGRWSTDQIVDRRGLEFTEDQRVWVEAAQAYYTRVFIYDEVPGAELRQMGERLRATVPLELTCGDYFLGKFGYFGQDVYLLGGVLTLGTIDPCAVCGELQTFKRNNQTYCVPCGGYVLTYKHRGGKIGNR